MNPVLYRGGWGQSSPSLLNLTDWQEKERKNPVNCAVDKDGALLDNLTLELRVTPPQITIDNNYHDSFTFVKMSSANRPGSLIHVVQHLTELGFRIHSSRVTSCGGWFVDDFYLTEVDGSKVRDPVKLRSIRTMLATYYEEESAALNGDETDDEGRVESTVFEMSGPDGIGLLANVASLLTHNGCNIRSAAVWTYRGRVAFVLSVTEKGRPISDRYKLDRLRQLTMSIMGGREASRVAHAKVRGPVHPDRRLHQLMLSDELDDWRRRVAVTADGDAGTGAGQVLAPQVLASPAAKLWPVVGGAMDMGMSSGAGGIPTARVGAPVAAPAAVDHHNGDATSDMSADTIVLGSPAEPSPSAAAAAAVVLGGRAVATASERNAAAAAATMGAVVGSQAIPAAKRVVATDASAPDSCASSLVSEMGDGSPGSGVGVGSVGAGLGPVPGSAGSPWQWRSPKYDAPHVDVEPCASSGYWVVSITCRDRPKLLFDTVCTLADMDYDIWHATIDALPGGAAAQEYHVRPRVGESGWDPAAAACLRAMLESSIQRRFPPGVKLRVRAGDRFASLADLTRVLAEAGLSITRAKIRTYATSNSSGHTFYVMDRGGCPPSCARIQAVCAALGGTLVDPGSESLPSSLGSARFTFSFLQRAAAAAGQRGGSSMSSSCGSI